MVMNKLIEPEVRKDRARIFHDQADVAELAKSGEAGLFRSQTSGKIFLRFKFDVLANLVGQTGDHAIAAFHDSPSSLAGRRMRVMATATLSHLLVARASCRRS